MILIYFDSRSTEFRRVSRSDCDFFSFGVSQCLARFQFLQASIASGPPRRSRSLRRSCLGESSCPGDDKKNKYQQMTNKWPTNTVTKWKEKTLDTNITIGFHQIVVAESSFRLKLDFGVSVA